MPETRSGRATPIDPNKFDVISVIKKKLMNLKQISYQKLKNLLIWKLKKS